MMSLLEIMDRVAKGMNRHEANLILEAQAEEMIAIGEKDAEEAKRIIRTNIGYIAGYYNHEIADRAYELFDTEHPIFGRKWPSPEEALRLGMEHGRRSKERSKLIDHPSHPNKTPMP